MERWETARNQGRQGEIELGQIVHPERPGSSSTFDPMASASSVVPPSPKYIPEASSAPRNTETVKPAVYAAPRGRKTPY